MIPDLVYPVRDGLDNEELRYSLRSIDRFAGGMFGTVWVVGNVLPDWLVGVKRIQVAQHANRVMDVHRKMRAIVECDEISPVFALMNDDHFLMESLTEWRAYQRCTLAEFYGSSLFVDGEPESEWARCVAETAEWVVSQGGGDVLYQTHRPPVFDRAKLRAALDAIPEGISLDVDGLLPLARGVDVEVLAGDCKVYLTPDMFRFIQERNTPWLSSADDAFELGLMGGFIRGMFQEPSRWEV